MPDSLISISGVDDSIPIPVVADFKEVQVATIGSVQTNIKDGLNQSNFLSGNKSVGNVSQSMIESNNIENYGVVVRVPPLPNGVKVTDDRFWSEISKTGNLNQHNGQFIIVTQEGVTVTKQIKVVGGNLQFIDAQLPSF